MNAQIPPPAQLHRALINLTMRHLSGVTAALAQDPFSLMISCELERAAGRTEFEKRWPIMLAFAEALAEVVGSTCNVWPDGEREAAFEFVIKKVTEHFEKRDPRLSAAVAAVDLTRTVKRPQSTEPGAGGAS